jgi:hypothetical protein
MNLSQCHGGGVRIGKIIIRNKPLSLVRDSPQQAFDLYQSLLSFQRVGVYDVVLGKHFKNPSNKAF